MNIDTVKGLRMAGIGLVLAAALIPAMMLAWADASQSGRVQSAPGADASPSTHPPAITIDGRHAPWEGAQASAARGASAPDAQPATSATPTTSTTTNSAPDKPGASPAAPQQPTSKPAPNPVIVELFTSEGCSSCPPADRLLAELAAQAQKDHTGVIFLAFHVDYWDHLGWKDPFASADFTARQRGYSKVFNEKSVYTPQMVVNGRTGFVGSDRAKAREAIAAAGKRAPTLIITLDPAPTWPANAKSDDHKSGGKESGGAQPINISWSVTTIAAPASTTTKAPTTIPPSRINFALVESNLATDVKRGENAGSKLKHDRVVRAFTHADLKPDSAAGKAALTPPPGAVPANCSIVAWIEDSKTMAVLAAAEAPIKPQSPAEQPATAKHE